MRACGPTKYPTDKDWFTADMRCEDLDPIWRIAESDQLAYDAADHLADHISETMTDGRRIWDLDGFTIAVLAEIHLPGGAAAFLESQSVTA